MPVATPKNLRLFSDDASSRKDTSLHLAWDPVDDAVLYELAVVGPMAAATHLTNVTSMIIGGLVANCSVRVSVLAITDTERSAWSNEFLTCTALPVPPAPKATSCSAAGPAGIVVQWSWDALTVDVTSPVHAELVRITAGQPPIVMTTSINRTGEFFDVGPSGSQSYFLRLFAVKPEINGGVNVALSETKEVVSTPAFESASRFVTESHIKVARYSGVILRGI